MATKKRAQVVRKAAARRPQKRTTTTTTTTTRVVRANPSQAYTRRLEMLTGAGWPEAAAKKEARSFASWYARRGRRKPGGIRLASLRYTRRTRRRRNPEWGQNVKGWSPERRAAWRRSSEAAAHRKHKIGEALERRRRVHLKRHGRPGPGQMPAQLAARHASYARAREVEARRSAREAREEARERRKRRRNPMAKRKRTPAQRAAFRRMLAGLRAYKAGGKARRKKRSGRKAHARRRKTTTVVVATNPRRKRRKNSRGGSIMAKRRRRRTRTNPGRRHHRRHNPHRRHRRRNPGGGGIMTIVKSTIASAIPSMATGATLAIVDSKLFKDKALPVQVIGKLGLAAGAGYLLRGRPRTACLVMGAIMGGIGYQLAANAAGGIVAPDKQSTAKAMQALVYANPRMAALVNRDGSLRTQPSLSGMGQSMGDGGTALPTMPIYDPVNLG